MARYSKAAYVEVATAIRMLRQQHQYDYASFGLDLITSTLADIFASDNPAFDRERFINAAIPNGGRKTHDTTNPSNR